MNPADEAVLKAREATERLRIAYQRVFDKGSTKEDRNLVLNDLEAFCNVRSDMLRPTAHGTAHEVGKFRVWQRIHAFRFPRPADARSEFKTSVKRTGGLDNGEDEGDEDRRAGRGVAEETQD